MNIIIVGCSRVGETLAAELVRYGTKAFLLAHLSEENNTPELAFDEFFSSIAEDSVTITVAAPDTPTELTF